MQYAAGERIEPQVSEPMANGTRPAATAEPEPLEEPPLHASGRHGLTPGPVNAALALGQQPRPKVRAQAPEAIPGATPGATIGAALTAPTFAPPAAPLSLPAPEALGVVVAPRGRAAVQAETDIDWNTLRGRLRQRGIASFHLDQVAEGHWRATLLVPGDDGVRHVEACAATEAAAVLSALERAEGRP